MAVLGLFMDGPLQGERMLNNDQPPMQVNYNIMVGPAHRWQDPIWGPEPVQCETRHYHLVGTRSTDGAGVYYTAESQATP